MVVTRIAPSPSGLLHVGNAVNFLLTDWVARQDPDSRLHLRIDDMNLTRVPDDYLDDIFWAVEWLGIRVTDGPSGASEHRQRFTQLARTEEYRAAVAPLVRDDATYVCECSRTTVAVRPAGTTDPCISADLPLEPERTALRFRPSDDRPQTDATRRALTGIGVQASDVAADMGDFVVWRRDDLPAYHLASALADEEMGVDTVVRGADLRLSSAAQLLLADALGLHSLSAARFLHHDLVTDRNGAKMSKRDNADALRAIAQNAGGRQRVIETASAVAAAAGIPRPDQDQ